MNDVVRMMLTEYIKAEFADRPDLLEKVVPTYPPGSKRMLRDNGIWARTLKRDNVQLITTPIREITPTGIVTDDGVDARRRRHHLRHRLHRRRSSSRR